MRPRTKYAKSGDIHIAYQVLGDGPRDLVYVPGWISHVEYAWEDPSYAQFLRRLSGFSRLILFDKRGTGLSDRDIGYPTLEQRMDDVRAVMDAVGSERAAIFGMSEGGNMSTLFAATYPERTVALVLFSCFAKRIWAPDYPWAPTVEEREAWLESIERDWGEGLDLGHLAPSRAQDEDFCAWLSAYFRFGASPRAAVALGRLNTDIDVCDILSAIHVPTLVLHRTGDRHVKVEETRYMAERIPNAKLVELPGEDHLVWTGGQDAVIDEIEEFLTGVRHGPDPDRVLLTVLFTDIVESTATAAKLGDRGWREVLERHDAIARKHIGHCRGREVKTTGDGFLAAFDGPGRAIHCAAAIRDEVGALGLAIRAGLHTGECERRGDDLSGIAVHLAARVLGKADPGEILVSSTVKDLVVGSGIDFAERGEESLKGVPGTWRLFAAGTSGL
jgi:pimeloyl-ACP methyl ester carboxylesterase